MGAIQDQRQYGEGDCCMWLLHEMAKANKRKYNCTTHSVVSQIKYKEPNKDIVPFEIWLKFLLRWLTYIHHGFICGTRD